MAENSKIGWTDHSFNWWEGCTKVGPGCDACYALTRNNRYHGGRNWGPGAPRMLRSEDYRRKLRQWNGIAEKTGERPWVFIGSLMDFLDNEVPEEWRQDLFNEARYCTNLRIQFVTKRIGNALKMLPTDFPENFGHCGFIATMVNPDEVRRDAPKLRQLKEAGAAWVGVSIEPQLAHVSLAGEPLGIMWNGRTHAYDRLHAPWLDWIITGGESRQPGHTPRDYHLSWARSLIEEGAAANVPVFCKQLGSSPVDRVGVTTVRIQLKHPKGEDPSEWPPELRVQQMPRIYDREA